MTTLFEDTALGPGTHVFVVAVDHYRHLPGGEDSIKLKDHCGLAQLSSPGRSAARFIEWLGSYQNPDAPLKSIEMAWSRPGIVNVWGNSKKVVDPATLQGASLAFERWRQRCDAHSSNVALFYFVGHGVWRDRAAILLEDFGAIPGNPFIHAWDVSALKQGMASCKASTQCFFIDACRKMTPGLEDWLELKAPSPIRARVSDLQRSIDAPVIFASAPGCAAHGDENGVTLFLEALLMALNGVAARKVNVKEWRVRTGLLVEGINAALDYLSVREGAPQQISFSEGSGAGSALHRLEGKPQVIFKVRVLNCGVSPPPQLALSVGGQVQYSGACDSQMRYWQVVDGDAYHMEVTSSTQSLGRSISALPPPEVFEEVELS